MESLAQYITEYRKQMKKGAVRKAYRGVMLFIGELRARLKASYGDYSVSAIYPGAMDMTFFAFTSDALKKRRLKVVIVFLHENCCFEVWLAGANKQIQREFWQIFKDRGWHKYDFVTPGERVDALIRKCVVDEPDFDDLDLLQEQIERAAVEFGDEIEFFLSRGD